MHMPLLYDIPLTHFPSPLVFSPPPPSPALCPLSPSLCLSPPPCRCQLLFDFSDHIVLNLVQYVLPCVLEAHYCLCSCGLIGNIGNIGSTTSSAPAAAWAYAPLLASALIVCASLRSMLLTCMFFHTSMENAVGFAVAAALAYAPLCTKRAAVLWAQVILAHN
jgi:hypothetical protein